MDKFSKETGFCTLKITKLSIMAPGAVESMMGLGLFITLKYVNKMLISLTWLLPQRIGSNTRESLRKETSKALEQFIMQMGRNFLGV